jgi:hypothetical protein
MTTTSLANLSASGLTEGDAGANVQPTINNDDRASKEQ